MVTRLSMMVVVLVLVSSAPAEAVSVSNGGFESTAFSGSFNILTPGNTTLTDWTVDGAGIVHVGTFWENASGDHSVELNFFASGGISQTITTVPGEVYNLEFDMAGQTNVGPTIKEMQIYWDGALVSTQTFDVTGHSLANMGWEHRSVILPAATGASTELRFFGSVPASSDGGAGLDNVSLSLAVPEPTSVALLVIGVIAFAARRRG